MDANILVPLIAGLTGAVIGSAASIIAVVVQARLQNRMERLRIAVEAAKQEYSAQMEHAKTCERARIPPLSIYIHYQVGIMKLIEQGNLSKDTVKRLNAENELLERALTEPKAEALP